MSKNIQSTATTCIRIQEALGPTPTSSALVRNARKHIKPRDRKDLHFPPSPTIPTTSSSTITTDDVSKNFTSEKCKRILRQQGQPATSTSDSSKVERQLKGSQALRNSSSILAGSAKTPEPPGVRCREHHIKPQPLTRVNPVFLFQPTLATDSLIPLMHHHPMNQLADSAEKPLCTPRNSPIPPPTTDCKSACVTGK